MEGLGWAMCLWGMKGGDPRVLGLGRASEGEQGWVGIGKGMDWICPTHCVARPTIR